MSRIENKLVAHFRDGRIVKGYTYDFNPNKEIFHITKVEDGNGVLEVSTALLKAAFFVKTFEGDKTHPDHDDFCMESFKNIPGIKVKVTFFDDDVNSTHEVILSLSDNKALYT